MGAQVSMPYTKAREFMTEPSSKSPPLHHSPSAFARPRNPEPFARPRTDPPKFSRFPKPPGINHGVADPFNDPFDDIGLESWTPRQTSSQGTGDISMVDMGYSASTFKSHNYPWQTCDTQHAQDQRPDPTNSHARQEKNARQVIVTLRDDQLDQIVSATPPFSTPSKPTKPPD